MDYRHSHEVPESVKHWSGFDPSNPPHEEFPDDMVETDCGHVAYANETREVNARVFCPNCRPTLEDRLNDSLDRLVAWIEGWFK